MVASFAESAVYLEECLSSYHNNYSVRAGIRTYFPWIPKLIQVGEHQYVETKLAHAWRAHMLFGWYVRSTASTAKHKERSTGSFLYRERLQHAQISQPTDTFSGTRQVDEQDIQEDYETFTSPDGVGIQLNVEKNPGSLGTTDSQGDCPSKELLFLAFLRFSLLLQA